MNNLAISYAQSLDRANHLHPKTPPAAYRDNGGTMIVKGQGSAVWDERGKRYLDAVAGLANVNVGYGRREIVEAVAAQMSALSYFHCFTAFSNPAVAQLGHKLADIMPEQFKQFFFTSSGSEAIDTAVKIAQLYWSERGQPSRRHIISRQAAYHGNTIFASALTGMQEYHDQFALPLSDISHIAAPYHFRNAPDLSPDAYGVMAADLLEREIERVGPANVAAFIAEPIQASGGCIVPPDTYWPRIREICDRHGVLLIVDEVITGFGRLGQWLGETAFGVEGEIVAMAKGISSGYMPMGAVGVGAKVAEVVGKSADYLMHGFSATGHPAACAATLANIAIIEEENLLERVRDREGEYFRRKLAALADHAIVGEVRSRGMSGCLDLCPERIGLSSGLAFDRPAAVVQHLCHNLGLLVRGSENVVLLSPPLVITIAEIDEIMAKLSVALDAFAVAAPDL